MSGFLDVWTKHAPAGADGSGTLLAPASAPSGPEGGRRRSDQRQMVVRAAAAVLGPALVALGSGAGSGDGGDL